MDKHFLHAFTKADSIDENNFTMDFVMSAEVVDRHGDIVDITSMKFTNFMKNPVVLPSHDHSAKSVAKVEKMWVEEDDGVKVLIGRFKFAVEEYSLAKTYWNLYKGGYMNAVSIGFIPESMEVGENGVTRLMESELLEVSFVSIPANQLALAKAKGIDIKQMAKEMAKSELISLKDLIGDDEEEDAEPETTPETPEQPETAETDENEQTPEEAENEAKKLKEVKMKRLLNKTIRAIKHSLK